MDATSVLERDSQPAEKPIVYRTVVDVPLGSMWEIVLGAGLYVAAMGISSWVSGQVIVFDVLSIVIVVGMVWRVGSYGMNLIQRRRFRDVVEGAEVLAEVQAVSPEARRSRLVLIVAGLGLVAFMVGMLFYFQGRHARIPALWMFYPPFVLVSIGASLNASLMSSRGERLALTAEGLVSRNWLFRTFFPWGGIRDVVVETDARLLRIISRDLPGWETLRLGPMPEEEFEWFVRQLGQFVTVRKS